MFFLNSRDALQLARRGRLPQVGEWWTSKHTSIIQGWHRHLILFNAFKWILLIFIFRKCFPNIKIGPLPQVGEGWATKRTFIMQGWYRQLFFCQNIQDLHLAPTTSRGIDSWWAASTTSCWGFDPWWVASHASVFITEEQIDYIAALTLKMLNVDIRVILENGRGAHVLWNLSQLILKEERAVLSTKLVFLMSNGDRLLGRLWNTRNFYGNWKSAFLNFHN